MKRSDMRIIAATYWTKAKMKKILPMVVKPVKRCGVPARTSAMPAVERGRANCAHVKLFLSSEFVRDRVRNRATHCFSRAFKVTLCRFLSARESSSFTPFSFAGGSIFGVNKREKENNREAWVRPPAAREIRNGRRRGEYLSYIYHW